MKVLLVAEEAAGVRALQAVAPRAELAAVLTSRDGGDFRGASVGCAAHQLGVPVWPAERVREPAFADELRALGVDVLLNVHSLHLIDPAVASAPRVGSFNLHPGPLPGYAGLNAPSWAIFRGEKHHAVTLHRIDAGVDTGAIVYEDWFPIADDATGLSVSVECVRRGLPLIERLLEVAARDPEALPSKPQDRRGRHVFKRHDVPFDAQIPWHESADTIHRLVRACDYYPLPSPWGYARTRVDGLRVEVVRARRVTENGAPPGTVTFVDDTEARVAAHDGGLGLQRFLIDGKNVAPSAVLQVGMRLE